MSKVSYILGAGASYGERMPRMFDGEHEKDARGNELYDIARGLPVMNEMKEAVQQLLNNIEGEKQFSASPPRQMLKSALIELHETCTKYPTVDHYARILYTNEEWGKYYNLKAQLSIAFMLWQKLGKYDQRYISFLNDVINPHTGKLPAVTILSWNYDVQLEMAYDNYIKYGNSLTKAWDELNVYCKTYPASTIPLVKTYDASQPFSLIKLNGSALFYENKRDDRTLRFTIQDPFWHMQDDDEKYNFLYNIYTNRETGSSPFENPKYVNGLSYTWESSRIEELKERIRERVYDTEELVVIGYSFPNVNFEIDGHIINNMPNLKQIYIQDMHADNIAESIRDIYKYLNRKAPSIERKKVGCFFIPNALR